MWGPLNEWPTEGTLRRTDTVPADRDSHKILLEVVSEASKLCEYAMYTNFEPYLLTLVPAANFAETQRRQCWCCSGVDPLSGPLTEQVIAQSECRIWDAELSPFTVKP